MKILVIRFGAIGDLVLVEPAIRLLSEAGHQVHLLSKDRHVGMFEGCSALAGIHSWENRGILKELRKEGFDAILDAHNNVRSRWVGMLLWPASVYRMPKQAWRKLPLPAAWKQVPTVKERLLNTLVPLVGEAKPPSGPWPGIVAVSQSQPYRVLVLGATYFTKQIPLELAAALMNRLGGHWVLLGSQADLPKAEELLAMVNPETQVDVRCKQGLSESASWLAGAQQVISGDTGMAHWAAALHTPLHVIWGNTSRQFGLAPGQWGGSSVQHHEVPSLDCRPCSKFGFPTCPQGHFRCMRNQNIDSIVESIKNLD